MQERISIITVVFNAVGSIEKTIQSVLSQNYQNVEYIVVDGGSTDGTLDIIKKYDKCISQYVSEKDDGIYDAMNKGLKMASGEWINFMNAGDCFSDENVLSRVFAARYDRKIAVVYGNCRLISGTNRIGMYAGADASLLREDYFYRHNASFVRTEVQKKYMFEVGRKEFGYALDYRSHYRIYCDGFGFKFVELFVVDFPVEGASNHHYRTLAYHWAVCHDGATGVRFKIGVFGCVAKAWLKRNSLTRMLYGIGCVLLNKFGSRVEMWPVRRALYKMMGVRLKEGAYIGTNVTIMFPYRLSVGKHSVIGNGCCLNCTERISIGNDAVVGNGSTISTVAQVKKDGFCETMSVRIGDTVHLEAGSRVGYGETINS